MSDRLKILLIDDDEEEFLIISEMLAEIASSAISLDWVRTYGEGLEAIRRPEYDACLLDYLLDTGNGLDLLGEAIAKGCKAPVIFLTAYGNYEIDVCATKAGAADYLVKGEFTVDLLERTIRHAIERKHAEEELKRHRQNLEKMVAERTVQHAEARLDAERRAQEAEQGKSILEALLEHIPAGIMIVDSPDLTIRAISRYAFELAGAPRQNFDGCPLSGRPWSILRVESEHPEPLRNLPIARAALSGQVISNEEWTLRHDRGRSIPVLISAGPIRDKSGEVTGAIAVWRDIGDLKRAREELRQARDDLEVRVYHRTLELAEAMASLRNSQARLKSLTAQLIRAQEDERKRIAREMHDSIGSSLSAVKFSLENAARQAESGSVGPELYTQLSVAVSHAIEESRRIMTDLRPSILDDLGIIATIGWLCRRHRTIHSGRIVEEKIAIRENEIPENLKITIYRIIQEAMNNIAKYSRASNVTLLLVRNGDSIELCVEDDGVGFDPQAVSATHDGSAGFGLTSMRERTELSEGCFRIESAPGAGTRIQVSWPLPRARENL